MTNAPGSASSVASHSVASPILSLDYGQVQVQVLVARLTEENFAVHLKNEGLRIKRLLSSSTGNAPKKAIAVSHPSISMPTTPTLRRMQADWLRDHEDLLRLVCHSVAFVVPNPVVRFTMTAVLWLMPLPVPTTAHESLEHAIDWAVAEAKKIGGDVSSELVLGGVHSIQRRMTAYEREIGRAVDGRF